MSKMSNTFNKVSKYLRRHPDTSLSAAGAGMGSGVALGVAAIAGVASAPVAIPVALGAAVVGSAIGHHIGQKKQKERMGSLIKTMTGVNPYSRS